MARNANNVISLLDTPFLADLIASTPIIKRTAGEVLFEYGEPCTSLPLVKSGSARIYAASEDGRQITLYRLKPGEICQISLSTLLQRSTYPAAATAESDVQLRLLSGKDFISIMSQTPEVFAIFLDTFADCLYQSISTARQQFSENIKFDSSHKEGSLA